MDNKLKEAIYRLEEEIKWSKSCIDAMNGKGKIPPEELKSAKSLVDALCLVIVTLTRLYEQPEELPKKMIEHSSYLYNVDFQNGINIGFNQCIDLITPQFNKLKAELKQATLKISELENTDNLRREQCEA